MKQKLLDFTSPSLKQFVKNRLEASLCVYTNTLNDLPSKLEEIPLFKSKNYHSVVYVSGVALQLAKSTHIPPQEVATKLASYLCATCENELHIQILPPGWLHLQLSDTILAAWLQRITVWGLEDKNVDKLRYNQLEGEIKANKPNNNQIYLQKHLFTAQYTHARCCSLLRMAHREGLITLAEPLQSKSPVGGVIHPNPLPWLHNHQLRINKAAEMRLIANLVQVLDNLYCLPDNDSVDWGKAVLALSQAVDTFWQNCRIWGEIKSHDLQLSQVRLGLLIIARQILQFLLEKKFRVLAPWEL